MITSDQEGVHLDLSAALAIIEVSQFGTLWDVRQAYTRTCLEDIVKFH